MAMALPAPEDGPPSVERVPTLTEVVDLVETLAVVRGAEVQAAAPAIDADALVAQVLQALQPQLAHLAEARLRDALAPALARATDALVRDAREQLAGALRELVQDAVSAALRQRAGA